MPLHDQSTVFLQLRHGPDHYHVRKLAANNVSPTYIHALQAGSPAINHGSPCALLMISADMSVLAFRIADHTPALFHWRDRAGRQLVLSPIRQRHSLWLLQLPTRPGFHLSH